MNEHVSDLLSGYLDAELVDEELDLVRAHLPNCPQCQEELDELRAIDRIARDLPPPELAAEDGDLALRVRARLLADAGARPARVHRWLAAAAALGAVTMLPWLMLRHGGSDVAREVAPTSVFEQRRHAPAPSAAPLDADSRDDKPAAPAAPPPVRIMDELQKKEDADRAKLSREWAREDVETPPTSEAETTGAAATRRAVAQEAPQAKRRRAGTFAEAPAKDASMPEALSAAPVSPAEPRSEPPMAGAPSASAADESDRDMSGLGYVAPPPAAMKAQQSSAADEAATFRALGARRPATGDEARRLREEWRAFLRRYPGSPRLAEARLGLVEAGATAYRLDGRAEDLERLQQDVAEYQRLASPEQGATARRLLEEAKKTHSP